MNQLLYYIKAKVSIGVFGISGKSQEGVSALIRAVDNKTAKEKFEYYCKRKFKNMHFESMDFEYLEIAPEIDL
jgi:phage replication-related protein YjqB (UPF0714/DUF867 family)